MVQMAMPAWFSVGSAADEVGIAAIRARLAAARPEGVAEALASVVYAVGLRLIGAPTATQVVWCGDLVVDVARAARPVTGAVGVELAGADVDHGVAVAATGSAPRQWVVACGAQFPVVDVARMVRRGLRNGVGIVWVTASDPPGPILDLDALRGAGFPVIETEAESPVAVEQALERAAALPVSVIVVRSSGPLHSGLLPDPTDWHEEPVRDW